MQELKKWFDVYERETIYNRALPSLLDGMKPIHRKIFFTALKTASGKFIGTDGFSGAVKQYANYHHGDASRDSAICNMTANFKNNIPLFIGKGNFGNRFEPTPAAVRYTSIKLNNEFTKYMIMNEILKYTPQDDNNCYEPDNYFFSIPMVLVNGISGIAVGLKTDILPYNSEDIKRNVLQVLNEKKQTKLIPYIPNFNGEIKFDNEENKWYMYGKIESINSNTLHISEIPANYTQEKYISILQKLKDSNIIVDYRDSTTKNVDINVKMTRVNLNKYGKRLIDIFKLKTALNENINVLNPKGDKVLHYDTPEDLITDYVLYMIEYTREYIRYKIKEYTEKIDKIEQKIKFIEYVLSIDIRKVTSKEIKDYSINKLKLNEEYVNEFMHISILGLTKDSIKKYQDDIKEYEKLLKKYKNIIPQNLYKEFLEVI